MRVYVSAANGMIVLVEPDPGGHVSEVMAGEEVFFDRISRLEA